MQLVEKIEIAQPMEPKWIRADSLWSRISGNMFFSTEEKKWEEIKKDHYALDAEMEID